MGANRANAQSLQAEDLIPLEFFDGYSPGQLRDLVPYLEVFQYKPDDGPIFHEDLTRKGIQLILDGEVNIVKIVSESEGIRLATLIRGQIFGEASMFDTGPHTSTVEATIPTRTVAITRDSYERLSEEKPHLAEKIARKAAAVLSDRLRQANETVLTYAIWSRSLQQQTLPPAHWRWQRLNTSGNLLTVDLDKKTEE